MAKLGISTGTVPNDGTGDTLLSGAIKINSNFNEIYNYFGNGTNIGFASGKWVTTTAGIHTLSNIGIGTTNPTSKLTVTGNGIFTGVVTATTFIGALTGNATGLSGTPNITIGTITATSATVGSAVTINSSGVSVTGVVTATSFLGDGSALTGVVGSGSGVVVKDSGTTVGTAGTIDFGDNLTVSAISAGIVTVTAIDSGSSQFAITTVGIHTLSNVGIGTTNPTIKLYVLASDSGAFNISTTPNLAHSSVTIQNTLGDAVLFLGNDDRVSAGLGTLVNNGSVINLSGKWNSSFLAGNIAFGAIGAYKENNTSANQQGYLSLYSRPSTGNLAERVRISSSGNIGIGTTNPTSRLTVVGSGTSTSQLFVTGVSTVGVVTGATYFGDASRIVSGKWTLGASGSSDYTFTGIGFTEPTNDPALYLARGAVYEFVNNMGAHPFRIQSTPNGSTGTQYNNGVTNNDVSNGTLRFEIPFNAPNTLYYQCTAHAGMGGIITIYPSV